MYRLEYVDRLDDAANVHAPSDASVLFRDIGSNGQYFGAKDRDHLRITA